MSIKKLIEQLKDDVLKSYLQSVPVSVFEGMTTDFPKGNLELIGRFTFRS